MRQTYSLSLRSHTHTSEYAYAYVSIHQKHKSNLLALVELAYAVLMYALTLIVVQCLYQRRRPYKKNIFRKKKIR